jgi:multiple sugar transport system substrate-binding protein
MGDAARRTLDYMHALVAISPPDILTLAWDDAALRFLSGGAAMSYAWSMRATRYESDMRSAVKRRVRYLSPPTGRGGSKASALSGFLLAVPANLAPDRAELAWEAIGWLVSTESRAGAGGSLPVVPRFSVAADPEARASAALTGFLDAQARQRLLHTRHRPLTPNFARIETILGEEIHAALSRERPDREALARAAQRISRLSGHQPAGRRVSNGDLLAAAPVEQVREPLIMTSRMGREANLAGPAGRVASRAIGR